MTFDPADNRVIPLQVFRLLRSFFFFQSGTITPVFHKLGQSWPAGPASWWLALRQQDKTVSKICSSILVPANLRYSAAIVSSPPAFPNRMSRTTRWNSSQVGGSPKSGWPGNGSRSSHTEGSTVPLPAWICSKWCFQASASDVFYYLKDVRDIRCGQRCISFICFHAQPITFPGLQCVGFDFSSML